MNYEKCILNIFILVIVASPLNNIFCQDIDLELNFHKHGSAVHSHTTRPPCGVCAGAARCVPLVQCPAHLRSRLEACHVRGLPGVCCRTGRSHAAESDHKRLSAAAPLSEEDTRSVHAESRQRLASWINLVARLLRSSDLVTVNQTSPSHAHHLSLRSTDERVEELSHGGLLNMFAAQHHKARQTITDEQMNLGITHHTDAPFCPLPPSCSGASKYRRVGGECNNAAEPGWGAVNTGYERVLPPSYGDGIWSMRLSTTGNPLPSARIVSTSLLLDGSHPSDTHNLMFMQFGQFIAHDISAGKVYTIGNGSFISCCTQDGQDTLPESLQHPACAAIPISIDDPFYGQFQQKCLNFVRTTVVGNSDCTVGAAKQLNGATHFLDLSHLYGNTANKLTAMRAENGLLKTFNDFGRDLPPKTEGNQCITTNKGSACFDTGDNNGNQVISLTVLHTLWTREHNRIARELFKMNPMWDDETVFMEARRIVQAEFQHIIYNEWLPLLLGSDVPSAFGLLPSPGYSSSYDPTINPALTSEFSTSAMRFGHSVVDGTLLVPKPHSNSIHEMVSLPEVMFQPSRLRLRPFFDRLLIGFAWQPMQRVDPYVTEALTRYMFHGGQPFGLDLASMNIQRARDHGVRPYNDYRRLVGLPPVREFREMVPSVGRRLSSVYASPDDVDLWVGGLLEEPVPNGVVGATFANIIADQFSRLKQGDRYFYEHGPDVNPGAFSPSQLAEVKKVTLSRIICDNSDRIELVAYLPNAFLRGDLPGNEPVPCDSPLIPFMDLAKFKA